MAAFSFLTPHAHTLTYVVRHPRSTVREIALAIGLTERATTSIVQDLRRAEIVSSQKQGRSNVHTVDLAALVRYGPWAPSPMPIPEELIGATVRALTRLAPPGSLTNDRPARLKRRDHRGGRRWGFLTNYALVLIDVTEHPRSTVREIAQTVGITERAALSILQSLREASIIERLREGRRNSYSVNFPTLAAFRSLTTGVVPDVLVEELLTALLDLRPAEAAGP